MLPRLHYPHSHISTLIIDLYMHTNPNYLYHIAFYIVYRGNGMCVCSINVRVNIAPVLSYLINITQFN